MLEGTIKLNKATQAQGNIDSKETDEKITNGKAVKTYRKIY